MCENNELNNELNELKSGLSAKGDELENEKKARVGQVEGFKGTENVLQEEIIN